MKKIPVVLLMFLTGICMGQDFYPVALIPDSLKTNASVVYREYSTVYNRISEKKYRKEVHVVITVLNERGKSKSGINVYYDNNSEVTGIKGTLYDANGRRVIKIKKKNINDHPAYANYTLFSDQRVKHTRLEYSYLPYTVEYSYSITYNGVISMGNWFPQPGYNVSTQKADLIINTPADLEIRYRTLNKNIEFRESTVENNKTFSWHIENLTAVKAEPYSPDFVDYMPCVLVTPVNANFKGKKGDFSSWNSYGKWVYNLIEGRDGLKDETRKYILDLTDTILPEKEKIKAIYKFMQSRTRYVNVTEGLGGFQPIEAKEVDKTGYGDCKALCNYTKALLKCADINAYYTAIGNSEYRKILYPDFASINQTNHVVLCVPVEQDTLWLECTSQSLPPGYLGTSSSGRYSVIISPSGGKLVRTPDYSSLKNKITNSIFIKLNEDGDAHIAVKTVFENLMYDYPHYYLVKSPREQLEQFKKDLNIQNINISSLSFTDCSESSPKAELTFSGKIEKYAVSAGSRMFITTDNIYEMFSVQPLESGRYADVAIRYGFILEDSVVIEIPPDFKIEHIPKNILLQNEFGNLKIQLSSDGNKIILINKFEVNRGRYGRKYFQPINEILNTREKFKSGKIIIVRRNY